MRGDALRAQVLSSRIIPQVDAALREKFSLLPHERALGLLTCDSDDVGYTALDEATKKAAVRVVYAQSMYAGAANANTKLAGEFLGILSGESPEDIRSGLAAAAYCIRSGASFYSANDDDSIPYFAHCISRVGTYLSESAGIPAGSSLAYLIAPPLESMFALDAALKAATVTMVAFYGPPSPTNFGGALLAGSQSDCQAACQAFAQAVQQVASAPQEEGV